MAIAFAKHTRRQLERFRMARGILAKLAAANDRYVAASSELCHLIVTLYDARPRPYAVAIHSSHVTIG